MYETCRMVAGRTTQVRLRAPQLATELDTLWRLGRRWLVTIFERPAEHSRDSSGGGSRGGFVLPTFRAKTTAPEPENGLLGLHRTWSSEPAPATTASTGKPCGGLV